MKNAKVITKRFLLLLFVEVLLVGTTSYYVFRSNSKKNAMAEDTWYQCINRYSTVERIACIASSPELIGYRYAGYRYDWAGYWRKYGYPEQRTIASSYGLSCVGENNVCTWWDKERFGARSNFLGCSGYVNVVLYLALGYKTFAGGRSYEYIDLTYTGSNGVVKKVFNKIEPNLNIMKPGDLIIYDGHVAIYNGKVNPTAWHFKTLETPGNQNAKSSTRIDAYNKTGEYTQWIGVGQTFESKYVKSGVIKSVLRIDESLLPDATIFPLVQINQ